ncbi:response regulator [Stackebrandtia soli]|uniref:response regulator n=1 Tax=Stackebrandtia soli TaxID=1892856 RepID=UPI0039EC2704
MSALPDAAILVVDDDATVADVVRRYLERDGYSVTVCGDGLEALAVFRSGVFDLVVLDVMLPGLDGRDVCRVLRAETAVPIVMLTARGDADDRIMGLSLGADDYLAKPFSPRELVLRVSSVLRRAAAEPPRRVRRLTDGDLVVDLGARTVALAGRTIAVTAREFDLLAYLLARPGRVHSRAQLLTEVWGWNFGDESTVTVHVRRLREKIEDDPSRPGRIITVWGTGYRYRDPS